VTGRLVSSAAGIDGYLTSLWGYRQIGSDTVLAGLVLHQGKEQGSAAVSQHTLSYTR
jgi:hypothetical protein